MQRSNRIAVLTYNLVVLPMSVSIVGIVHNRKASIVLVLRNRFKCPNVR